MALLCFLGSSLCRGWDSDALILFIYLVHNDMRLLANVTCCKVTCLVSLQPCRTFF